jgi:hypothetical protein
MVTPLLTKNVSSGMEKLTENGITMKTSEHQLNPWPLWFRITQEAKAALWNYQLETYGLYLEIPPQPVDFGYVDYDRLMKERPHYPAGRGYRAIIS